MRRRRCSGNFTHITEPGFSTFMKGFRIKKPDLPKGRSGKARKARRKGSSPLGFEFLGELVSRVRERDHHNMFVGAFVNGEFLTKRKLRKLKRFDAVHHTRGGSWKDGTLGAGNKEKAGDSSPSAL